MASLSSIKIPPPLEEPTQDDESVKREEEEEKLRVELLNLIFSKKFRYSERVFQKADLAHLQEIKTIYEQHRATRLVKLFISYLPVLVVKGLHVVDCIAKEQVEPLKKSLIEDELLEEDMVWLLGKIMNEVPCLGSISATGKIGMEVATHKFGSSNTQIWE